MSEDKGQRSHHGCQRCKKRRQKCDEERPQCSRCTYAGSACNYTITLKWAGRVARQINTAKPPKLSPEGSKDYETLKSIAQPAARGEAVIPELDSLSWLPYTSKALLHHYIHAASHVTSCHAHVQARICRLIIPLALQTPSLLYATTALAALHCQAAVNENTGKIKLERLVSSQVACSLRNLRHELLMQHGISKYALLITVRTLCICEIHSGKASPGSWRAHVEGAKALLESMGHVTASRSQIEDESLWLTKIWYGSIESLTALTHRGPTKELLRRSATQSVICEPETDDQYLDICAGYTTALNSVLREIGITAWERDKIDDQAPKSDSASYAELQKRAHVLETSIRSMINKPTFRPDVINLLSAREVEQFKACNEAYQYTALICIQRRVRKLRTSSSQVQSSVGKLLEAIQRISPQPGLSPWVMLTTPLYTAGCEALGDDRILVRKLMHKLHQSLRIPNVERAMQTLELNWNRDPNSFNNGVENILSQYGYDFIPY